MGECYISTETDQNSPKVHGEAKASAEMESSGSLVIVCSGWPFSSSPPSTRKCFPFKQYGKNQEPTSKEQTFIFLVGDLQKGRLIFPLTTIFSLLLIPFSALIKFYGCIGRNN